MSDPLEALLRPAYELYAASASTFAACLMLAFPPVFLLTPELALGVAGFLLAHAAWRASQGWRILRYRRNLRRQRPYVLASDEIPFASDRLFLGWRAA